MHIENSYIPEFSHTPPGPEFIPSLQELVNFENCRAEVYKANPELVADIEKSLTSPQLGPYHKEGHTMLSHLQLMTSRLAEIQAGQEDPSIPLDLLAKFQNIAQNKQMWRQFIFLHDMEKPSCMRLTLTNETSDRDTQTDITWEQWEESEKQGPPYQFLNPTTGTIEGVSATFFFHAGDGELPAITHGPAAAIKLGEAHKHPGVIPDILPLIAFHEVAFNFDDGINAKIYAEKIDTNSDLQGKVELLLFANYLDMSSCLRESGQPDLASFYNLLKSRQNYELIQQVLLQRQQDNLPSISPELLEQLYTSPRELSLDDLENSLKYSDLHSS